MPITRTRIRKFRGSRAGRFRPTTEPNLREQVIEKIHGSLYAPHWQFWHKKLTAVCTQNKEFQGRTERHPRECGIFYAGQAWFVPWMEATEAHQFDIIPLHPDYPELEKELITITSNLGELDIETYEVKRFLAGITTFPAPVDVMQKLLGTALFNRVGKYYRELEEENKGHVWNDSVAKAFHTYAEEHDYLINAMCQRVMMALITRDAFAQR